MLLRRLISSLAMMVSAQLALGQALYLDQNLRSGFGEGVESLDIFSDIEEGHHYILPRSMSNRNPRVATFELELIEKKLLYMGESNGFHQFRFFVIPDLEGADVLEVLILLTEQHQRTGDIVIPLNFESTSLDLYGLPQGLLESAEIFQISTRQSTQLFGYSYEIPQGYVYEIRLITRSPAHLKSVLKINGLRGNAEFSFFGYRSMEELDLPPALISQSVPVDVTFE